MNLIRKTTIEEFLHPISSYVVPLYAFSEQESYVAGTAVIIAPGIALTASHVIQSLLEYFCNNQLKSNIELDIYLTQFNTGATWYICNTATWIGTDISVLSLVPRNLIAEKIKITPLNITVDPPNKGDTVIAYGYPKTKLNIPRNDSEQTELKFVISPTLSEGSVTEINSSMRDSMNLRFPCFAVNAEYSPGMSGGAVFNQDRELCGLVCSGGKGDLINYSHATSIWPMSIIPVIIPSNIPPHDSVVSGATYKILDLAKLGYINLSGHDRIEFFIHHNGSNGVRRLHKV
jgi:hypothetical protein